MLGLSQFILNNIKQNPSADPEGRTGGPDPLLTNHIATKPAFNVGLSSAHKQNAN